MNNSCGTARPPGAPTNLTDGSTLRSYSSQL
jgi:hypothetical protein